MLTYGGFEWNNVEEVIQAAAATIELIEEPEVIEEEEEETSQFSFNIERITYQQQRILRQMYAAQRHTVALYLLNHNPAFMKLLELDSKK